MKTALTTLVTILFVSLLPSPSWGDGISQDDLVERDGVNGGVKACHLGGAKVGHLVPRLGA
jgi:hypothetical protein